MRSRIVVRLLVGLVVGLVVGLICALAVQTAAAETGNLVLLRAKIRDGTIRLQGEFGVPPFFTFPPSFTFRVQDGNVLDQTFTFAQCTATDDGRVRCLETTPESVFETANLKPLRSGTGFRFRMSFKHVVLDLPFAPPVTMTLTHNDDVVRTDPITNCRLRGYALGCRE
ncbi:MAG TPA: hypothetical protein VKA21_15690 [Candidatus Binatia bacterium]|nr:hypothetical protein [Candidatus Binatia bacterium]